MRPRSEAGEPGIPLWIALDSTRKNFSSDETHPFIPPPTREQLMARSAKLRRVYKIEA
jgi:hypothetical protein